MSTWEEGQKPTAIGDFEQAVEDLRQIWMDLGSALSRDDRITVSVRFQWGALTYDLISFCAVFLAVHRETVAIGNWQASEVEREHQSEPRTHWTSEGRLPTADEMKRWHEKWVRAHGGEEGVRRYWEQFSQRMQITGAASGRLAAATKAMFFFVRAYHDASYRVLLQLLGQRKVGEGSMNAAANNSRNPVAELLNRVRPHYLQWFVGWRTSRDKIKNGMPYTIMGPQWNPGVSFAEPTPDGGIVADMSKPAFRLSDIARAVRESVEIGRVALALAGNQI